MLPCRATRLFNGFGAALAAGVFLYCCITLPAQSLQPDPRGAHGNGCSHRDVEERCAASTENVRAEKV